MPLVPPIRSSEVPSTAPFRPASPNEPFALALTAAPSEVPAMSAITSQPPVVLSHAVPLADFRNIKLSVLS